MPNRTRMGVRSARRALALVLLVAAGLVALARAEAQPPPAIPSPPVTVPGVDAPDEAEPVLAVASPAMSFACAAYASSGFTFDFVSGLVVPIVLQGAGVEDPPDFRPLGQYLRVAAPACGFVPVWPLPSGCAADEVTAAQASAIIQEVVSASLRPYVGVPVPRVGLVADTLAATEQLVAPGRSPGLASAVSEAFDCRGLAADLRVTASGQDVPPGVGPSPTVPATTVTVPPAAAPVSTTVAVAAPATTTPTSAEIAAPRTLATEPTSSARIDGWAWIIVVGALAAIGLSFGRTRA